MITAAPVRADTALRYAPNSVGRIMDAPAAVFPPSFLVVEATEAIRELVKQRFVTYAYVADQAGRLLGLVTMRDLLLAQKDQTLTEVMLRNPFALTPELTTLEAMKRVLNKHYPCYPVCDASGVLVGLVWGHKLFEAEAIELSAQAGSMVGVEKEERLHTPVAQSLRFRHPWLQVNLLTAFVAAAVVGFYEDTINQIVALAVFLPVLAGQSGNTGCQALAVTLRGMTLGELKAGKGRVLVAKEGVLGLFNGFLVGLSSGLGMFLYAKWQDQQSPLNMALVTFVAMTGACMMSGLAGALVPLTLKRFGADPATASSIFLTTCTDVVSMGLFLGLSSWLLL